MARFDRYMLSQLVMLFGFFSFVLVMVYWINSAVRLFDQLIADGQSASVFLEFTALSLPSVIQLALPLAGFAAAIYVTNRMTSESEMVVMQATGYSFFRLARPVVYFGLIVMLLMVVLVHFLVPRALTKLDLRQTQIAQTATARLLTEGKFIEPAAGITVYISKVDPNGELKNIFLSDIRDPDRQVTYTAQKAFLVRTDATVQLVMIDGLAQTLRTGDQSLFTTSFDDFSYDIGDLLQPTVRSWRPVSQVGTLALLQASPALQMQTSQSVTTLRATAHARFAKTMLGLVAALVGFSTLMVGGFSRFGVWKQIVIAVILIIFIKGLETYGLNIAQSDDQLWLMAYVHILIALIIVWALLFTATRPYLFKRPPRVGVAP